MRQLVMTVVLIMVFGPCTAMEIPFRDGSVMEVVSYTVTGSYVMLKMENGGQIAYDVADIDLDALRRAEAAAAVGQVAEARKPPATLGNTGSLRVPEESSATPSAGLTITDPVSGSDHH